MPMSRDTCKKAWTLLALAMLLAGVVGLTVAVAGAAAAAAAAVAVEVAVAVARLQQPTPNRGPWRVSWPSKDGASFAASFAQLYRIFRARPTMISQKMIPSDVDAACTLERPILEAQGPE